MHRKRHFINEKAENNLWMKSKFDTLHKKVIKTIFSEFKFKNV